MKKKTSTHLMMVFLPVLTLFIFPLNAVSQEPENVIPRDTLIAAAREIMTANPFCALVTVDSTGQPQVRTMNPYPLGDEMVIWFATSRNSRKLTELKNDNRVSVYYADHNNAKGYVTLNGTAEIFDDAILLEKMKRAYWETYKIDWKNTFVLIKIIPVTIDVINYKRGVNGDKISNRAPVIVF